MAAKKNPKMIATTPEAKFLDALKAQGYEPPRGLVLPILSADPPENDPTNFWMRWDGRLRGRFWNGTGFTYVDYPMRTDATSPPAVPAYPAAPSFPAVPAYRQKTYTAIWSQTYLGDDTQRTDAQGNFNIGFGNAGDGNGRQKSLIGFDYATIATDLASSTIKKLELTLQNLYSYLDGGVDIYFGVHAVTAKPSTWPSASIPVAPATVRHFGKPESRTVTLPIDFAARIRAGTGNGIAIQAPSDAPEFSGYAAGVGSGYAPPVLTITYVK